MLKSARSLAVFLALAVLTFAADVSGNWTFTVESEQGTGNPTFLLKQEGEKLTGTYKGFFGEAPVSGTVKGDGIEIRIQVELEGNKIAVAYTGTIESDSRMKGKVQFGDLGSGTWTAVKK